MTKAKYITLIFVILALLFIPNISNAADTFTTTDGIQVKKVVTGFSNGSIELKVSNIEISSEGNYVWGVGKESSIDNITKWYVMGDINASKKTASLNLTVQDTNIRQLLRQTNTAYLFIKDTKATEDTTDDTLLVDALQIDLTLPPLYAFDYEVWGDSYYIIGGNLNSVRVWNGATYNIRNVYYKFEKITNETLVTNYKQALLEGTSLTEVFSIDASTVENIENWTACTCDYSYPYTKIDKSKIPTDQGAYYLWLKAKDTDSKTVYGCLIVNIDADGPIVEKIYVSSPEAGTYETGQTVKIHVGFSEPIVGSTVPTLKVKFGDSDVREISNGTIVNSGNGNYYWSHYIEYSYDIQDSDVGQLATVGLTGGNIKDSSGNEAVLSCPIITGNTIKANVDEGSGSNGGNDGEVKRETVEGKSYGEPLPADAVASIKDGCLYYAEDSSKEQEKIEGVSNIKQLFIANIGTGVNKAIFVVTEDGTVYRLNSEKKLVIYEELSKYKVSEIVKCEGETKAVFTLLLTDGSTAIIEVDFGDDDEGNDGNKTPSSPQKLPNTGLKLGFILVFVVTLTAGIAYIKCNKYREI